MTMPFQNPSPGPIEVTETDNQFLVRIPPVQKERARKIPGRRWNPDIKRWVYPKTPELYRMLREEFQKDADIFDIRMPPSKRLPKPAPQPLPEDQDDHVFEDWRKLTENAESLASRTSSIDEKLGAFAEQIESIADTVQAIEETTLETAAFLRKPKKERAESSAPPPKPKLFELSEHADLKILEKTLVILAWDASRKDQSFAKWLAKFQPLRHPLEFVTNTHEKLKESIGGILGERDIRKRRFFELVQEAKTRALIPEDGGIYVSQVLFAMNQHRNWLSHQTNFTTADRMCRSILYLFNLALVWPHIASEPEDDDNES